MWKLNCGKDKMFNAMTKSEQDYIIAKETVFFNSIFQMWYLFSFFFNE